MSTKRIDAEKFLDEMLGPGSLGKTLAAIREGEELSQTAFAKQLGISRQNLCDIEKDRKSVGPGRAARWAKKLGYSESVFVALALQALVEEEGLPMVVSVTLRKKPRGGNKAA
jgi:transcriptional regulator with XRE-family HTH domain